MTMKSGLGVTRNC